jgi:outer membrane lipoprotein-sorting protein
MKKLNAILFCLIIVQVSYSQNAIELLQQVKQKIEKVNDYTATGKLRTTVVFIKAPLSNIKVYFKKPDFFKIKRNGGISILPKGGIKVNLNSIVNQKDFIAVESGNAIVQKVNTKVLN